MNCSHRSKFFIWRQKVAVSPKNMEQQDSLLIDSTQDCRSLFFTNLLLLKFDLHGNEKKYGIKFSKDMFENPNHIGMEVIFQFLFFKLDAKRTDKVCGAFFLFIDLGTQRDLANSW